MAKRKSIKQKIAALKRQADRETKKKMFNEVCVKGKVETLREYFLVSPVKPLRTLLFVK
jgi:hypothetical protein